MKITKDPMRGKAAQTSQYHELFLQLTPTENCIVFEDKRTMDKVSQALDGWALKYIGPKARVKTTSKYPIDGKPRCWLFWPAAEQAAKTTIKGNWPA